MNESSDESPDQSSDQTPDETPEQTPDTSSEPGRSFGNRKRDRIDQLAQTAGPAASPSPLGTVTVADAGRVAGGEGQSLIASAWARLRRNPIFLVGAAITLLFVVLAVFGPWIAPHDPAAQTLIVGVLATVGGLLGGLILGTLAGAIGGRVDTVIMRVVDVMLSIPGLILAVSIAAIAASPSQTTVIIAIAVVQIPIFARLLRGSMLGQRASDHVLAARALGVRPRAVVFRHMLPNSLGPVIVQSTLVLATAIIEAAGLSFLGLGNPDDRQPEWGQMLGNAQQLVGAYPHLAIYPALCIIVVALGFTLMGESLREALDPKSRR